MSTPDKKMDFAIDYLIATFNYQSNLYKDTIESLEKEIFNLKNENQKLKNDIIYYQEKINYLQENIQGISNSLYNFELSDNYSNNNNNLNNNYSNNNNFNNNRTCKFIPIPTKKIINRNRINSNIPIKQSKINSNNSKRKYPYLKNKIYNKSFDNLNDFYSMNNNSVVMNDNNIKKTIGSLSSSIYARVVDNFNNSINSSKPELQTNYFNTINNESAMSNLNNSNNDNNSINYNKNKYARINKKLQNLKNSIDLTQETSIVSAISPYTFTETMDRNMLIENNFSDSFVSADIPAYKTSLLNKSFQYQKGCCFFKEAKIKLTAIEFEKLMLLFRDIKKYNIENIKREGYKILRNYPNLKRIFENLLKDIN